MPSVEGICICSGMKRTMQNQIELTNFGVPLTLPRTWEEFEGHPFRFNTSGITGCVCVLSGGAAPDPGRLLTARCARPALDR